MIEEVRGEGLMVGLKAQGSAGEFRRGVRSAQKISRHSRRRQCRAAVAAACRHRRGNRRGGAAARCCLRRGRGAPPGRDQLIERMNAPVQTAPRHFLGLLDLSTAELRRILDMAAAMKKARVKGVSPTTRPLAGKTLAMIFDRPSTRTRVSFDIGMRELGGETIMLTGAEMQLGRGETIADTARVLSRYVEAIVIRVLSQDDLLELACQRDGSGHQRAHQAVASVPGAGGPPYVRGKARPDPRPQDRLVGRLEQRAVVLGRRVGAVRLHPRHRLPARIAADEASAGPGFGRRARKSLCARTRRSRSRTPRRSSPIAGCRWATRTRAGGRTCSPPIRSTAG